MKVSVVARGYPGPSGGGAIGLAVLIQALQDLGHTVDFVKLDFRQASTPPAELPCELIQLEPTIDPHSVRRGLSCKDPAFSQRLRDHFRARGTDAAFLDAPEAATVTDIAVLDGVRPFVLLGDPFHLVLLERLRNDWLDYLSRPNARARVLRRLAIASALNLANAWRWRLLVRDLAAFEWGYATAAHHARFYARFNPHVVYQPSPVLAGPPEPVVRKMIEAKVKRDNLTALYIGHNLGGTSNTAGMRSLLRLLDRLDEAAGFARSLRVLVVGGLDLVDARVVASLRRRKYVTVLGEVNRSSGDREGNGSSPGRLDEVAAQTDLLLNTVSHTLGNRTRIAACAAYGIPAISHVAALAGMPGLVDGGALLYDRDADFIAAVARVAQDRHLQRTLSEAAYDSYRQRHSRESLMRVLERQLNRPARLGHS